MNLRTSTASTPLSQPCAGQGLKGGEELADLDRSVPGRGELRGDRERLVEVGALQQEVAGQRLLGLGVGPSLTIGSPPLPSGTRTVAAVALG